MFTAYIVALHQIFHSILIFFSSPIKLHEDLGDLKTELATNQLKLKQAEDELAQSAQLIDELRKEIEELKDCNIFNSA